MAKKFVRGVTGVDDIEKLDKTLTNVNDIISDGQNTYVHTKKGKNEFYYKVTDGVNKVVSSDNTLKITKDNDTVSISNNGLATNQDLSTKENTLSVDYGITKESSGNTTKIGLEYTRVNDGYDLNNLTNGCVRSGAFLNSPKPYTWFFVSSFSEGTFSIQTAVSLVYEHNKTYRRLKENDVWGPWRGQVGDKYVIDELLALKQNTITNNTSIGVSGTGLRQLYTNKQSYTHANGVLKTYVKSVSSNTSVTTAEDEFNFVVKINKGATSATFNLNTNDQTKFKNIMNTYGQDNSVNISECIFTLSGSSLTVSTTNNTNQNYVITFSDII